MYKIDKTLSTILNFGPYIKRENESFVETDKIRFVVLNDPYG